MSLVAPRPCITKPPLSKTFTSSDYGSAQVVLHVSGASAPTGVDRLPSSIFVVADAGDALTFKDGAGVSSTITFTTAFNGELPFTFASIESGSGVTSVTASWQPPIGH